MIYGYIRISTKKQTLSRQRNNILREFPNAKIVEEIWSGTTENRPKWENLLKVVTAGDTIIFDSVSRMSRNATEGVKTYFDLYNKGISLIFLKERTINTDVYKETSSIKIDKTNTDADLILDGINNYLTELAKKQIALAFEQSEKEVKDLQERTKESLAIIGQTKHLGRKFGSTSISKKQISCIDKIIKHNKDFKGSLNDTETMKMCEISRPTFYKYKKIAFKEYAEQISKRGAL